MRDDTADVHAATATGARSSAGQTFASYPGQVDFDMMLAVATSRCHPIGATLLLALLLAGCAPPATSALTTCQALAAARLSRNAPLAGMLAGSPMFGIANETLAYVVGVGWGDECEDKRYVQIHVDAVTGAVADPGVVGSGCIQ